MLIRLVMFMSIKTIIITRQDRSYEPKMVNLCWSRASQNTAWCTYLHCINKRHFFLHYTRNLATIFWCELHLPTCLEKLTLGSHCPFSVESLKFIFYWRMTQPRVVVVNNMCHIHLVMAGTYCSGACAQAVQTRASFETWSSNSTKTILQIKWENPNV
jgi:hypothetical protein